MRYFRYFPQIEYGQGVLTNIVARAKIRDVIRANINNFYTYTIQDGERPDTLAHKYYGSVDMTWLIFLANDILDPLYDWPLTYAELNSFVTAKYGSIEAATQGVKYYFNLDELIIDLDTYNDLPAENRYYITNYEYEVEMNERKRDISLLDDVYASSVLEDLRDLFR